MNIRNYKIAMLTLVGLAAFSATSLAQTKSSSPLSSGLNAAANSAGATVQQGLMQSYGGGAGMPGLPYGGYPVYNAYLPYGAAASGCLPGMPGCSSMPGAQAQQTQPKYVYKGAAKKGMIDAPLPKRLFNNIPKRR